MKNKTKEILEWYSKNARVLPWRHPGISAYEVWVSEIMLQQTQVSRGIIFYERFLKRFSTIQKLAEVDWEEFLPYYERLGYYNRGRNMLKAAKIIVDEFGGEFPKDKTALIKLPGIGEYSASAILSFAHDLPYVAFDTNFKKMFGTREVAEKAFKTSGVTSSVFNSAVMDYASAHRGVKRKKKKGRRTKRPLSSMKIIKSIFQKIKKNMSRSLCRKEFLLASKSSNIFLKNTD
ncbi:MAG: hypothetical protein NT098_00075 [Candidatus Parcubacteria bacterium]|nr:hypothetical protein [Candidatus Parcubacteria bacterium]